MGGGVASGLGEVKEGVDMRVLDWMVYIKVRWWIYGRLPKGDGLGEFGGACRIRTTVTTIYY